MSEPDFWIEVYKGRSQARQSWRWRAINAGNNRKMATGHEAYTNKADCIDAATALFSPQTTVHLRHPNGQAVLREGLPSVICQHCGHEIVFHMNPVGCDHNQCDCTNHWVQAS